MLFTRYTYLVADTELENEGYFMVLKLQKSEFKSVYNDMAFFESVSYTQRLDELMETLPRKVNSMCFVWFFKKSDIAGYKAHSIVKAFEDKEYASVFKTRAASILLMSATGLSLFRSCNRYHQKDYKRGSYEK